MPELNHDLENRGQTLQPKAIMAGDQYVGQPVMIVTDRGIFLVGDKDNVIHVDPEFGVQLAGKLSLSATPDQISIAGGYWRLNPLLLSCVPSTSATPMPVLVKSTPSLLQAKDHIGGALSFLKGNL